MNRIKRCVSLYSYQDAYALGRMSLEEIFVELSSLEVEGFELVSDQMIHGTPFPNDSTLREWDRLMEKYGIPRICNDIFINTKLYSDRYLTVEESIASLRNELALSKRLGFPMVRLVCHSPWEVIQPVMDEVIKEGLVLTFEIHGGMGFNTEATRRQLQEVKRINSPSLGLVIDTSLFMRRFPRKLCGVAEAFGVSKEVLDYIDRMYKEGRNPADEFEHGIPADMVPLMKGLGDRFIPQLVKGYENNPLTILDEWIPYIRHIHAKVVEIQFDGTEEETDWDGLVRYLHEKGYNGYISTEYEGQRYRKSDQVSDEIETVRAHQNLLRQCIEKYTD